MKINWGRGIVIAIALFIGFILYFVIKMSTNDKYDHDLVTQEYYKEELAFQEQIDKEKNLAMLSEPIKVTTKKEGIEVVFPSELKPADIEGTLFLYRPSNKKLDLDIPLSLTSNVLFLPKKHLVDGRWNINLAFKHQGVSYFFKKEIHI